MSDCAGDRDPRAAARAGARADPAHRHASKIARVAAKAYDDGTPIIPLADSAPCGAVLADRDTCTLCLSCMSLCPSGTLLDNPDRAELRFVEETCPQSG